MDELKYYIEDIDAIFISCPKCGKNLEELAFFNLAIEIYKEKNKLMEIIYILTSIFSIIFAIVFTILIFPCFSKNTDYRELCEDLKQWTHVYKYRD